MQDQPTRLLDTSIRTGEQSNIHNVLLPGDRKTRQKVADELRDKIVEGSPCGFYDPQNGGEVNFITEASETVSR